MWHVPVLNLLAYEVIPLAAGSETTIKAGLSEDEAAPGNTRQSL